MPSDKSGGSGGLGWFVFGAAVGAVLALLTAPRTGKETRELLQGGDVGKRAQEWAGQAQQQAGEWLDKSRVLFEEQTERLISAFEAGKEAMREEIRKWSASARG